MKKLYKYISLVAAKLVGRRHNRDVDPPGLKELKNAFVSKSDSAITVRPDFNPIAEDLPTEKSEIEFATSDNSDDYLNTAIGLYGADNVVFLSTFEQLDQDGGSLTDIYATGTASIVLGSKGVQGSGTSWNAKVWPGCVIEFQGNGTKYKVDSVTGDTHLGLTKAAVETLTGVSYVIYRTHQPDHADYKFNVQPYTSGVIYSCPSISVPINEKKICGPFYSNVTTSVSEHEVVAEGFSTDLASLDTTRPLGPRTIAANSAGAGMRVVYDAAEVKIMQTSDILDPESWVEVSTYAADFFIDEDDTVVDIIRAYDGANYVFLVGGKQVSTDKYAVAYTDDLGESWTVKANTGAETGFIGPLCSASSGGNSIYFASCATVPEETFYTEDFFDTWTPCTGISFAGGDSISAIRSSNMWISEDSATEDAVLPVVLILTWAGAIFYSFYDTNDVGASLSDLGAFTEFHEELSGTEWLDLAVQTRGSGDSRTQVINAIASPSATPTAPQVSYTYVTKAGSLDQDTAVPVYSTSYANRFYCVIGNIDPTDINGIYGGTVRAGGTPFIGRHYYPTADSDATWYYGTGNVGYISSAISAYSAGVYYTVCDYIDTNSDNPSSVVISHGQGSTIMSADDFTPLSDVYRSVTHSVLDGYVMLLGLYEYDSTADAWEYFPRRVRWTTPLTYNDFASSGSGSADLDGSGSLLDSRAVNGRIVTFESSSIGSISPRGYATDPWEYDKIKDNIRAISNPVVVDDMCYFIDDSGLLRATNGISVESPPFSFDLTEYDDFNADSPVWLTYSPELESLVIFNPSDTNRYIYLVEPESGTVSRFQAPELDLGGASAEGPKSVVCVENSSDRRLLVSFNPDGSGDGDSTKLLVSELSAGETITGKDEWTANAGDDTYHSTVFETGEVFLVPEGQKTSIKHIIVRTYTDGTTEATNPVVGVQVRSLEDSAWHCAGDTNGTITVDTDSCDGTSTAWSNTLDATNDPVYATPCLATQARIYVGSAVQTLGTDYTITDTKEITLSGAAGDTVYAYWENIPEVKVEASDLISTTEGHHLISSVTDQNSIVLDHYLASGSDATAVHIPAERMPTGDGEVKIGLNKLVEGVRIRVIVMHDASGDATVTKVTGIVVGHVPCGEKIVEP